MTRFAILIEKTVDTSLFEETLASVLANRPSDCQLLALCPGGYDDPYDLAGEVEFVVAPERASTAQLVNLGLQRLDSDCPVVHLLASGCVVDEGWSEPAISLFDDPGVAAVCPRMRDEGGGASIGVRLSASGRPRAALVRGERPPRHVLGPTFSAAFYRRSVLEAFGGVDEAYSGWLGDIDLALSLSESGQRVATAEQSVVCGPLERATGLSAFQEAYCCERLFWNHRSARLLPLVTHPAAVLLDVFSRIPRGGAFSALCGHAAALAVAPWDVWRGWRRRATIAHANISNRPPMAASEDRRAAA